jgi:hypothetical protein
MSEVNKLQNQKTVLGMPRWLAGTLAAVTVSFAGIGVRKLALQPNPEILNQGLNQVATEITGTSITNSQTDKLRVARDELRNVNYSGGQLPLLDNLISAVEDNKISLEEIRISAASKVRQNNPEIDIYSQSYQNLVEQETQSLYKTVFATSDPAKAILEQAAKNIDLNNAQLTNTTQTIKEIAQTPIAQEPNLFFTPVAEVKPDEENFFQTPVGIITALSVATSGLLTTAVSVLNYNKNKRLNIIRDRMGKIKNNFANLQPVIKTASSIVISDRTINFEKGLEPSVATATQLPSIRDLTQRQFVPRGELTDLDQIIGDIATDYIKKSKQKESKQFDKAVIRQFVDKWLVENNYQFDEIKTLALKNSIIERIRLELDYKISQN